MNLEKKQADSSEAQMLPDSKLDIVVAMLSATSARSPSRPSLNLKHKVSRVAVAKQQHIMRRYCFE